MPQAINRAIDFFNPEIRPYDLAEDSVPPFNNPQEISNSITQTFVQTVRQGSPSRAFVQANTTLNINVDLHCLTKADAFRIAEICTQLFEAISRNQASREQAPHQPTPNRVDLTQRINTALQELRALAQERDEAVNQAAIASFLERTAAIHARIQPMMDNVLRAHREMLDLIEQLPFISAETFGLGAMRIRDLALAHLRIAPRPEPTPASKKESALGVRTPTQQPMPMISSRAFLASAEQPSRIGQGHRNPQREERFDFETFGQALRHPDREEQFSFESSSRRDEAVIGQAHNHPEREESFDFERPFGPPFTRQQEEQFDWDRRTPERWDFDN